MADFQQETRMYETKHDADPLEASFAGAEDIAQLKAGMADLKAKLDGATVAAARAPLDGAKAATDAKRPFVERYLRHGNTGGVEVKAIDGTADATGGYAVPQEIDAQIDQTLTAISLIGDELVQFASAVQTAPRTYRLSGLLRGRRGTEWAMASHAAGERFVLVDSDTLLPWALPASAIGTTVMVSASGVGDASPAESSLVFQARALRPPSPVAISAMPQADGSILVGWTRRSRQGWAWLDDIDAPLGEESELYRLTASRSGGASLSIDTLVPTATIAAEQLAAIGGSGPLALSLVQVGTAAATLPPAIFTCPLGA